MNSSVMLLSFGEVRSYTCVLWRNAMVAKYLNEEQIMKAREYNRVFLETRKNAFLELNIDLLDTDTSSALGIFNMVSQYDKSYKPSFSRNGKDGESDQHDDIESKNTKVEGYEKNGKFIQTKFNPKNGRFVVPQDMQNAINKRDAGFQFHVMGDISHKRYVFSVCRKDTMDLLWLYDISKLENVKIIDIELARLREKYLLKNNGVVKYDVICLTENFIISSFTDIKECIIDGCEIRTDLETDITKLW